MAGGTSRRERKVVTTKVGPTLAFWRSVIEQILSGELGAAADAMASAGTLTMEANLRKHWGTRLLASRRTADGEVELGRALDFYRSVNARYYIAQIERALADVQSESA